MRNVRLLLAPPVLMIPAVLCYLGMTGTLWLAYHRWTPTFSQDEAPNTYWFLFTLCGTGFFAGQWRAKKFHPALDRRYAQWLAATPWNAAQPLPLGPIHLQWQDALLGAILFSLARFHLHLAGLAPVSAFLAGYLVVSLAPLGTSRQTVWLALLGMILPAALLNPESEGWIFAVALAGYLVTALGLQRGLRSFPWKMLEPTPALDAGWPASGLGQTNPQPKLSLPEAMWVSGLLAWWTFCIATRIDFSTRSDVHSLLAFLAMVAGFVVAGLRVAAYTIQTHPPLSVLGRLIHGPWIIPGYDEVWVGPLAVLGASVVASFLAAAIPYPPLACALGVDVIVLPALMVGPTLGQWKLTGQFSVIRPRPVPQNSHRTSAKANWLLQNK